MKWLSLLALGSLVSAGCGGDTDDRFPAIEAADVEPLIQTTAPDGPICHDGDVIPCVAVYGEHAGIVNCFEGEQTCVEGAWSACVLPSGAM